MKQMTTHKKRTLSMLLALLTLAAGLLAAGGVWVAAAMSPDSAAPGTQTFTGYVIDEDCFGQGAGEHPKGCLEMSQCAASGFGIAVLQNDGSYRFAFLDGTAATASGMGGFKSPAATGAQAQAYNVITQSPKNKGIAVTVTGTLKGNTATSPDGDEIAYPVITALSVTEKTDASPTAKDGDNAQVPAAAVQNGHPAPWTRKGAEKQTLKGYLIDEGCFVGYTALGSDPGEESKACLSMPACAASGYGIAVRQSDQSLRFYFFDGTAATAGGMDGFAKPAANGGQKAAYDLIAASGRKDHIYVTVTGSIDGNVQTSPDGDGIGYPVLTADAGSLAETAAPTASSQGSGVSSQGPSSGASSASSRLPSSDSGKIANPKTGGRAEALLTLRFLSAAGLLTFSLALALRALRALRAPRKKEN